VALAVIIRACNREIVAWLTSYLRLAIGKALHRFRALMRGSRRATAKFHARSLSANAAIARARKDQLTLELQCEMPNTPGASIRAGAFAPKKLSMFCQSRK
jgi:hypothetical protein